MAVERASENRHAEISSAASQMARQDRRSRDDASRTAHTAPVRRGSPDERKRLRAGAALDAGLAQGSAGGGGNMINADLDAFRAMLELEKLSDRKSVV